MAIAITTIAPSTLALSPIISLIPHLPVEIVGPRGIIESYGDAPWMELSSSRFRLARKLFVVRIGE